MRFNRKHLKKHIFVKINIFHTLSLSCLLFEDYLHLYIICDLELILTGDLGRYMRRYLIICQVKTYENIFTVRVQNITCLSYHFLSMIKIYLWRLRERCWKLHISEFLSTWSFFISINTGFSWVLVYYYNRVRYM